MHYHRNVESGVQIVGVVDVQVTALPVVAIVFNLVHFVV